MYKQEFFLQLNNPYILVLILVGNYQDDVPFRNHIFYLQILIKF